MGNRWATGCMIWIFPILAVLFTAFMLFIVAVSSDAREGMSLEPALWTDIAIFPWIILNNPLGLGLLLGFTAVLFAGEYQWNTWKSIVPRSRRVPLIIVKFITVALFVVFAFTLMSILLTLGWGLVSLVAGAPYGPSLDGEVLADFAEDYSLQMLSAFISTIIAAGIASLAAMVTRSILGSVIFAIVISIGETVLFLPLALLAWLLNIEEIMHIYRFIPFYNRINLMTYMYGDTPDGMEMPSGEMVVDSLLFSEVVLVGWVIILIALTAYLFNRQDITN